MVVVAGGNRLILIGTLIKLNLIYNMIITQETFTFNDGILTVDANGWLHGQLEKFTIDVNGSQVETGAQRAYVLGNFYDFPYERKASRSVDIYTKPTADDHFKMTSYIDGELPQYDGNDVIVNNQIRVDNEMACSATGVHQTDDLLAFEYDLNDEGVPIYRRDTATGFKIPKTGYFLMYNFQKAAGGKALLIDPFNNIINHRLNNLD